MTEETQTQTPPGATYHHCKMVFEEMNRLAKDHEENEVTMRVYEGFLTKLFEDLGLSVPYYSKCTTALKQMGCIRQLRRGGGNSPSQWELLKEPTEQAYTTSVPKRERRTRADQMQSQINDLQLQLAATIAKINSSD